MRITSSCTKENERILKRIITFLFQSSGIEARRHSFSTIACAERKENGKKIIATIPDCRTAPSTPTGRAASKLKNDTDELGRHITHKKGYQQLVPNLKYIIYFLRCIALYLEPIFFILHPRLAHCYETKFCLVTYSRLLFLSFLVSVRVYMLGD